jgi:hypothetical protein
VLPTPSIAAAAGEGEGDAAMPANAPALDTETPASDPGP